MDQAAEVAAFFLQRDVTLYYNPVTLAEADKAAERFLREIRVLAGLSHPHIAQLHTAFQLRDQVDRILVVDCPEEAQVRRAMAKSLIVDRLGNRRLLYK